MSQAGLTDWKDNRYKVIIGDEQLIANVVPTNSMSEHTEQEIGRVRITDPGDYDLSVVPVQFRQALMNLRSVRLIPEQ